MSTQPKTGSEVERDAARDDDAPKQHGREWGEAVDDSKRPPPEPEATKHTADKDQPGSSKPDDD